MPKPSPGTRILYANIKAELYDWLAERAKEDRSSVRYLVEKALELYREEWERQRRT